MMRSLRCLILLLSSLCICHTVKARVDIRETKPLVLPVDPTEPLLSAETSQKILPKKIDPGESGSSVLSEIADNSFSTWWNQSSMKESGIGKVADDLDKKLKTEVNLGSSGDSKIEHKLSVKVLAMQALAKVEYQGWVRAALNYNARAAKAEAEIFENIASHQDLVLSHAVTSSENRSQVSYLWNW